MGSLSRSASLASPVSLLQLGCHRVSTSVQCPGCQKLLKVSEHLAGTNVRCPSCGSSVEVRDIPVVTEVEAVPGPRRADGRIPCPECGQPISPKAKKCPRCRTWLDLAAPPQDAVAEFAYPPCPNCHSRDVRKLTWTIWGSFYGPAVLGLVRCNRCRQTFSRRTGQPNLGGILLFCIIVYGLLLLLLAVPVGFLIHFFLTP